MVKVPAPEGGSISRRYFARPKVVKFLEKESIGRCEKINGNIASVELVKFLMLKEVECPLANEESQ